MSVPTRARGVERRTACARAARDGEFEDMWRRRRLWWWWWWWKGAIDGDSEGAQKWEWEWEWEWKR
jgi:hypothetical protein